MISYHNKQLFDGISIKRRMHRHGLSFLTVSFHTIRLNFNCKSFKYVSQSAVVPLSMIQNGYHSPSAVRVLIWPSFQGLISIGIMKIQRHVTGCCISWWANELLVLQNFPFLNCPIGSGFHNTKQWEAIRLQSLLVSGKVFLPSKIMTDFDRSFSCKKISSDSAHFAGRPAISVVFLVWHIDQSCQNTIS